MSFKTLLENINKINQHEVVPTTPQVTKTNKSTLKDWMERIEKSTIQESSMLEGATEERMEHDAQRMSKEDFLSIYPEFEDFWMSINLDPEDQKELDEVALDPSQVAVPSISGTGQQGQLQQTSTQSQQTSAQPAGTSQMGAAIIDFKKPNDPLQKGLEQAVKDKQVTVMSNLKESKITLNESDDDRAEKLNKLLQNYPYESKMAKEGWGMSESLYQALCDHYWENGFIPREIMYGPSEKLHEFVEECYMKDTQPVMENPALLGLAVRGAAMGAGKSVADHLLNNGMQSDLNSNIQEMETTMKETKEVEESGLQAYLGKKKYGEKGMEALQKAGREGASKEEMAKIRAKFDKIEEQGVAESEQLDEKAKSKAQQRFMGMVHAAHKGEKPASKEVAKVAKDMGKKDAEDFAKTKHKGLPEKVKKTDESVEEDVERGHMHDIKQTATGRKVTRRVDPEGMSVGSADPEAKPRGRGRPTTKQVSGGPEFSQAAKSFFGIPQKPFKAKDLPGKASVKHRIKEADMQIESWDKQLQNLLQEGMTITTSTGNAGASDSVSISATDADAEGLMKLLQNSGLMHGKSSPMSVAPAEMGNEVSPVQPVSNDEVMSTLEPSEEGDDAFGFLKRMLGARAEHAPEMGGEHEQHTGDYAEEEACEECGHADCQCDHDEVGEMHNQTASAGDANMSPVPEAEMEEGNMFTGNLAKARAAGKKEADLDGDGDMEKVDEEALDQPATMEEKRCDECGGVMEANHQCESSHDEEKLDEWANSVNDSDEKFLADLAFMTKTLSGGLNNMKQDQTVLPSTRVKTETESKSTDTSIASMLKKLSNIN